jgi:hypothetical protein
VRIRDGRQVATTVCIQSLPLESPFGHVRIGPLGIRQQTIALPDGELLSRTPI